jgi:hypothetical protein
MDTDCSITPHLVVGMCAARPRAAVPALATVEVTGRTRERMARMERGPGNPDPFRNQRGS